MISFRQKIKTKQHGFTLVETLTYIFIMSMLIAILSNMILNIFNTRKILVASYRVHDNARFIVNFLNNRIHNVDVIDDVSPEPETVYFYQLPDKRFSLVVENDKLVYRETEDTGGGFPDQDTATAVFLNSSDVRVEDFYLTPMSDDSGNSNQGVRISFTLSIGSPGDRYGHLQKTFNTFISLR
ncbi:hypothetical protein C4566_02730 [Candidatus Parcubacteria bacterium]|nr:MAG: hypothetical protein C4566_02730 [Candidatus Parcubacteria bacterium]